MLRLMIRGTPDHPEYKWVTKDEIAKYKPFSWRLYNDTKNP